MASLKIYIAVSFLFVVLPFTEAGIIKNAITGFFGGKNDGKKDQNEKPTGENFNNENDRSPGFLGGQNRPSGEYGAAGTYTIKPIVIDGTTEKYKNTSWYIENEDYLSPNKNEMKQPSRPQGQYEGAGTYTLRPTGGTTERHSGNGNYNNFGGNQQQRPTENYYNNQNNRENYNERPTRGGANINDGSTRGRETTRSSIPGQNSTESKNDSVVLRANDITCKYSNLREEIEKRKLTCNEKDCVADQVYEKSSLWVCGGIKCTIANVDFSKDHGSKSLIECSIGRHIIDVPIRCGPDEKEVRGKCRKVF